MNLNIERCYADNYTKHYGYFSKPLIPHIFEFAQFI